MAPPKLERLGQRYEDPRGGDAVRRAFAAAYPEAVVVDLWLRAREAQRDVVAVIYTDHPELPPPCGIPSHRLFAVDRALATVALPDGPGSPYAIRGIK